MNTENQNSGGTHGGAEDVLVIDPPGKGKTDGIAAPTLLKSWLHGSAIVYIPPRSLRLSPHPLARGTYQNDREAEWDR